VIGKILDFLSGGAEDGQQDGPGRLAVATCALLLELAYADGEFDHQEERRLRSLLAERFELTSGDLRELLERAHRERHESVDLYSFTRVLNDVFDPSQKQELLRAMWRVVYADGTMHHHEEYLVRRLSDLLHVPHRVMMATKLEILQEIKP